MTRQKKLRWRLEVLTILIGKKEIPVGKSNDLRHFVWKVSGNKSCDLKRGNFSNSCSHMSNIHKRIRFVELMVQSV